MRRIMICDLDGCIADDRWRRELIGPREMGGDARWHAYHIASLRDAVVNLHEIAAAEHLIILTGRPLRYREITEMWLREVAGLRYLHLLMRNDTDHCPAVVLKRRMVAGLLDANSYGVAREELVGAIDDLEEIVQMYRTEFNLNARVVRIGDDERS